MCSRSMLVTTERIGESFRNERSLSSASATRYCDFPKRAFDPIASTRPPTTTVGSSPPPAKTAATIEVVVAFPCMPAMAMPYFSRINSASTPPRCPTQRQRTTPRPTPLAPPPPRRRLPPHQPRWNPQQPENPSPPPPPPKHPSPNTPRRPQSRQRLRIHPLMIIRRPRKRHKD